MTISGEAKKKKEIKEGLKYAIGILVIAVLLMWLFGVFDLWKKPRVTGLTPYKPTVKPTKTKSAMSLARTLAILDEGFVFDNHPTVLRIRSLLEQLSEIYGVDKELIADATVGGQVMLEKDGIRESILSLLEAAIQFSSLKKPKVKYQEVVAAYVTVRVEGMSRQEAIEGIQGLIQGGLF